MRLEEALELTVGAEVEGAADDADDADAVRLAAVDAGGFGFGFFGRSFGLFSGMSKSLGW